MEHNYFIASENVLGIRTNLPEFKWLFGMTSPAATKADYERCAVRLRLEVTRHLEIPAGSAAGKYDHFRADRGADQIFYDRAFAFGTRLRLEASGLLTDEPTLRANRTYYRWIAHRLMNLHSLAYILTDLACLSLLRHGFSPVHCSAFQTGDATVVVVAPNNTGKTLTTITACLDHGAKFLSEDLAITDGKVIYAVPWTSTFRYYRCVDRSWGTRIRARLTSLFPPLELFSPGHHMPITNLVAKADMLPRAKATHLVFLERGEPTVEKLAVEEATRQIENLNRYEFNHYRSPIIVASEFFNSDLDIAGACRREGQILRELVTSTQCLRVRANDPTTYAKVIVDALSAQSQVPNVSVAA